MARVPEAKNWVFTYNNPTLTDEELISRFTDLGAEYGAFQLEAAPGTGTLHFQGMVMFSNKIRLRVLKEIDASIHWEVMRGRPQQAREYAMKEDSRAAPPAEFGVFPEKGQGRRSDLLALHEALRTGLTQAAYSNEFFSVFVQHPNLVTSYSLAQIPQRDPSVPHECLFIYGPPGTGKSRLAGYYGSGGYRHDLGKWFDGYRGEWKLILDDFGGASLPFRTFKRIVDRYPVRVEVKGTSCELATTYTVITSNFLPEEWWCKEVIGTHVSAICRRITSVIWAPLPDVFYRFQSYASFERNVLAPKLVVAHQDGPPAEINDALLVPPPWSEEVIPQEI